MKRMGRLTAVLLALALAACAAASADGWARWPEWTCPVCGMPGNTGNYCPNCACPRPSNASGYPWYGSGLEQIPGEWDRVKIRVGSVTANSYIVNRRNESLWIPSHAADGDDSTCWQFSTQSVPFGRVWLNLAFTEPQSVDEIWFKAGYWQEGGTFGEQYTANCRPRDIRVDFVYKYGVPDREDSEYIQLRDDRNAWEWQRVAITHREDVTEVRLWVLSAYPGSSYPYDVCLSEVMAVQDAGGRGTQGSSSAGAAMPQPVRIGGGSTPTPRPWPAQGGGTRVTPQPTKAGGSKPTAKPQPTKAGGSKSTAKPQPTKAGGSKSTAKPQPTKAGGSKSTAQPQPQPIRGGSVPGVPSADSAALLTSLATRSGPSTEYDEPGTFFKDSWQSATVRVLGKSWDGGTWWVLADFAVKGTRYRVWTGMKRVSVDMDSLPEILPAGSGTVTAAESRRGPGEKYARGPVVSGRREVTAFGRENGYVEVEYTEGSVRYRVWVPEACARISWY